MFDGTMLTGSTPSSASLKGTDDGWASLFERYPAIRRKDTVVLLPGNLRGCGQRTQHREAAMQVEAGRAYRTHVVGCLVLVAHHARKLSEPTLAYHVQRAMMDAALVEDGFTISSDDDGRQALRTWLLAQPSDKEWGSLMISSARGQIAALPSSGPRLPYTVAWRGPLSQPFDLRLSVVLHPNVGMKKQLEELPLRFSGQPKIPIILRPTGDDTTWSRGDVKLVYKGPRYRALLSAFRERGRLRGMFPYFLTSTVLDYRPELWVRQQS